MIELKNIKKIYDQITVLNIPNLQINAGEHVGVVGNNGAGKTTMFRLLLDLIKASEGEVYSKEHHVVKTEDWKAYTSAYIDEAFLLDFLTADEYFAFVGNLYGLNRSDVEERLQPFHDLFNGEIIGNKKLLRDLSKGNQKKAGVVGALISEPEILILDEPFANLDPTSQIRLKQLIAQASEGRTVLISSHDLNHVTEVCERIVVLEKGQLVKDIATSQETLKELETYFSV